MNSVPADSSASANTAKIVYILYLLGLITGITALVGLVMAYIYRDDAPDWVRTHYVFQIRTFWFMLLFGTISVILCAILIGFLLLFLLTIWWIVRTVKGLKLLSEQRPYPDPQTLMV
jgi:uncharacterized membrane protein